MDFTGLESEILQMNYSQVAQADLLSNHADQIIDLTDPNVLVTTYGDLGLMILIIGLICLISGYLIGSMRDVDYGKPE